jgi:hypothetical protein
VDEIRKIPLNLTKTLLSGMGLNEEELNDRIEGKIGKELISSLLSRAGKGKDELIQILGREIGFALAAVLKEPLRKIVESKKLTISVELTSKDHGSDSKRRPPSQQNKKKTRKNG